MLLKHLNPHFYRNYALILLCLASAIPNGVFGSWQAVLDVLLDPIGLNQVIKLNTDVNIFVMCKSLLHA